MTELSMVEKIFYLLGSIAFAVYLANFACGLLRRIFGGKNKIEELQTMVSDLCLRLSSTTTSIDVMNAQGLKAVETINEVKDGFEAMIAKVEGSVVEMLGGLKGAGEALVNLNRAASANLVEFVNETTNVGKAITAALLDLLKDMGFMDDEEESPASEETVTAEEGAKGLAEVPEEKPASPASTATDIALVTEESKPDEKPTADPKSANSPSKEEIDALVPKNTDDEAAATSDIDSLDPEKIIEAILAGDVNMLDLINGNPEKASALINHFLEIPVGEHPTLTVGQREGLIALATELEEKVAAARQSIIAGAAEEAVAEVDQEEAASTAGVATDTEQNTEPTPIVNCEKCGTQLTENVCATCAANEEAAKTAPPAAAPAITEPPGDIRRFCEKCPGVEELDKEGNCPNPDCPSNTDKNEKAAATVEPAATSDQANSEPVAAPAAEEGVPAAPPVPEAAASEPAPEETAQPAPEVKASAEGLATLITEIGKSQINIIELVTSFEALVKKFENEPLQLLEEGRTALLMIEEIDTPEANLFRAQINGVIKQAEEDIAKLEAAVAAPPASEPAVPAVEQPAPAATKTEEATGIICPSCAMDNKSDNKFCNGCGSALKPEQPKEKLCGNCDAPNDPNNKHCGNCGSAF